MIKIVIGLSYLTYNIILLYRRESNVRRPLRAVGNILFELVARSGYRHGANVCCCEIRAVIRSLTSTANASIYRKRGETKCWSRQRSNRDEV